MRAAGVDKSAAHSRITVWCGVGSHEVKVASQTLAGLTQRHGCDKCRNDLYLREHEARHGLPELVKREGAVFEVELPDGSKHSLDVTLEPGVVLGRDIKAGGEIVLELSTDGGKAYMPRKSTKADKEIAEREKDEEEAFQGNLPGTLPPDRVEIPEIEAAAVSLDRWKAKHSKAGASRKDANKTLDLLMEHHKLREYVLNDGRYVRPRGVVHFDVVEAKTGERKKAEDEKATGQEGE